MTPDEIRLMGFKDLNTLIEDKVTDPQHVTLVLAAIAIDVLRETAAQLAEIKDLLGERKG